VLGALFCLSLGFAVGWYLGLAAGLAGGLVPMALLAALFVAYGGAVVGLEGDRLTAGRAQIELRWVRAVTALTPEEARARRGPRADTRAYLLLRPYVTAAVEVTLADPADPAPYWLISSRRPRRLAGLVASALPTSGPDRSRPVGSGG
jgi:hypothetical protein